MFEAWKHHHDLWKPMDDRSELRRVRDARAALDTKPLSHDEQRFVTGLILHLSTIHRAMKSKMFVKVEGLEKDIKEFFALPIPKAVWQSVKPFQNKDFVRFMEKCLAREPLR